MTDKMEFLTQAIVRVADAVARGVDSERTATKGSIILSHQDSVRIAASVLVQAFRDVLSVAARRGAAGACPECGVPPGAICKNPTRCPQFGYVPANGQPEIYTPDAPPPPVDDLQAKVNAAKSEYLTEAAIADLIRRLKILAARWKGLGEPEPIEAEAFECLERLWARVNELRQDIAKRDEQIRIDGQNIARLIVDNDCLAAALSRARQVIDTACGRKAPFVREALEDIDATLLVRSKAKFQSRVQPWMLECFGAEIAADQRERNHRFLEEALELVQACGCTREEAGMLVAYVFDRPVGERAQEVGGVMVTLAALCLAAGIDMHEAGETELARVWTKIDKIREKQRQKPRNSPLPGPTEGGSNVG